MFETQFLIYSNISNVDGGINYIPLLENISKKLTFHIFSPFI